ncbi:uncharacterized protein TNCV_4062871 [Trichonephila clavipes]|nr:uncharacterized protein TNCV_4062871 [Trichonephila clavipes]
MISIAESRSIATAVSADSIEKDIQDSGAPKCNQGKRVNGNAISETLPPQGGGQWRKKPNENETGVTSRGREWKSAGRGRKAQKRVRGAPKRSESGESPEGPSNSLVSEPLIALAAPNAEVLRFESRTRPGCFKCKVTMLDEGTVTIHQDLKSLSRGRSKKKRGGRPYDNPLGIILLSWAGTEPKRNVIGMMLKAGVNLLNDLTVHRTGYQKLPAAEKIELREDLKSRRGLAVSLEIICHNCEESTSTMSSKISNKCYDVNLRLTYGMRAIGKGGAAARIFCGLMNLPPPPAKFERHNSLFLNVLKTISEDSMNAAVHEAVIANDNNSNIAVAVDGTWHKRGYSSLNGVVCATSVENGKVIDFEALTKYCSSCKGKKTM